MYKAILFDLDGTLTDSGEGIMKSVQYALEKIGHPEPDLSRLRVFVGPPLIPQMMKYAGIDEETARLGVQYYRERYAPIGIYENELYPGIESMLQQLTSMGYLLGVASSKPEPFVKQVLEHFDILRYFPVVVGSTMDGARSAKSEVVEEALKRLGLSDERNAVVMVGDKNYDVYGARQAGLECLAVSYGYGSVQELSEAEPLQIIPDPQGIVSFFRRTPLRKQGILNRIWSLVYPVLIHLGSQYLVVTVGSLVIGFLMSASILKTHGQETSMGYTISDLLLENMLLLVGVAGLLAGIICGLLYRRDRARREYGRLTPSPSGEKLTPLKIASLLIFGGALSIAGNMIVVFIMNFLPSAWDIDVLASAEEGHNIWWLLIWTGILAPIGEEAAFRWLIYLRLRDRWSIWPSVLVTSAAFGIYHLNVPQGIYAFMLAAFFAWAMEMTGNIWASVLLHCGANIFSLILQEVSRMAGNDPAKLSALGMGIIAASVASVIYIIIMSISYNEQGRNRGYRAI